MHSADFVKCHNPGDAAHSNSVKVDAKIIFMSLICTNHTIFEMTVPFFTF